MIETLVPAGICRCSESGRSGSQDAVSSRVHEMHFDRVLAEPIGYTWGKGKSFIRLWENRAIHSSIASIFPFARHGHFFTREVSQSLAPRSSPHSPVTWHRSWHSPIHFLIKVPMTSLPGGCPCHSNIPGRQSFLQMLLS